jgi:hypothetical protein
MPTMPGAFYSFLVGLNIKQIAVLCETLLVPRLSSHDYIVEEIDGKSLLEIYTTFPGSLVNMIKRCLS